jgi:hypothetical protein
MMTLDVFLRHGEVEVIPAIANGLRNSLRLRPVLVVIVGVEKLSIR